MTIQAPRKASLHHRLAPAVVIAVLATQGASAAVQINFRPGEARPCDADVNRIDTTTPADIDQYVGSNQFDWVIVNENATTAGLPDANHVFFETDSATNVLAVGATFKVALTLRLLNNAAGGAVYGLNNPNGGLYTDNTRTTKYPTTVPFPSHVFMTGDMEGATRSARGISANPAYDLVQADPRFTKGEFRMFFDEDGDPASTSDRVLIAKLGVGTSPDAVSSFASTTFINQAVWSVIVNWDAARPGVFTDANGMEIAIGAADTADPDLRAVSAAANSSSKFEVGFKFECATAGLCTEVNANKFRMRLHMLNGSSNVWSTPATTTAPGNNCTVQKPDLSGVCFPFAFCPFPYFWIIVLVLVALAIVVVGIAVVRKRVSPQSR